MWSVNNVWPADVSVDKVTSGIIKVEKEVSCEKSGIIKVEKHTYKQKPDTTVFVCTCVGGYRKIRSKNLIHVLNLKASVILNFIISKNRFLYMI